jgi:hypothetical protein
MSEEQVERALERAMDALDERYLSTPMTPDEYAVELAKLERWAEAQYAAAPQRW